MVYAALKRKVRALTNIYKKYVFPRPTPTEKNTRQINGSTNYLVSWLNDIHISDNK